MKKALRFLLLFLALLLSSVSNFAHDFEVDGIYYNYLDKTAKTVEVTHKGSSFDSFLDEYTGNVVIPSTVIYNGTIYSVTLIGYQAFRDCTGLTSLDIPNSVTRIDHAVFSGCSNMTSITIPNSVTYIGNRSFLNCTGLVSITLPNSVTYIGDSSFLGCTGLTSISIPNYVTEVGSYAFSGCTGLTEVNYNAINSNSGEYDSPYNIFDNCSNLKVVNIGDSVKSISVQFFQNCIGLTTVNYNAENCTSMGTYSRPVFDGCSNLRVVNIGNSVKSIAKYAFYGCTGLNLVDIGDSVTEIGYGAFKGCSGLTSITIPNSVTAIGGGAFEGCSGLPSITIPNSVTSIGSSAFSSCTGLKEVYYNAENCTSENSSGFFGSTCSSLKVLNIGHSVKRIPAYAFRYCKNLTTINMGSYEDWIDNYAFEGCTNLSTVNISDLSAWCNINFNNSYANPLLYAKHLYLNGVEVKDLIIPDDITEIKSVFAGFSGITSVTIPNSVKTIGYEAFKECTGLTSVTIGDSVNSIGNYAFYGCTGLSSVRIGDSVTSIGGYAFSRCTGLTSVAISNSVSSISYQAFSYCSSLTSVIIPNSVTSIGLGAFLNCKGLKVVTVGHSVTSIGDDAFYMCNNLKSVINLSGFPFELGSRDYGYVTYHANWLLNAPNACIDGDFAWANVNNENTLIAYLGNDSNINLPVNFNGENYAIYKYIFAYRPNLNKVTIPKSVSSIANNAFTGCDGLTEINYNAEDCNMNDSSIFKNCPNLKVVNIGNTVKTIPQRAFEGCTGLTSITIPESVTWIDKYAFNGCTGLTEINFNAENCSSGPYTKFEACPNLKIVNIGNKVKTIPNGLFGYCSSLTSITIPNSVTSIDNNVFYDCDSLTSIAIPNSVTSIGLYAFKGCSGLTSISIPSSVTDIGKSAFWNCYNLISAGNSNTTQTTASFDIASPTDYQTGIGVNVNNEYKEIASENNNIFINELKPDTTYICDLGLIINGIFCDIREFSFTTKDLIFSSSDVVGVTTVSTKAHYEGDVSVVKYGINWDNENVEYNNLDSISAFNLDPNTTYNVYYFLDTKEGGMYSTFWSIKTKLLIWSDGRFDATSTSSARLIVASNCDATQGTGIEWRRIDAPDIVASSKVACPVVDGVLVGTLRNLNPNVYYKFRPYYTSSAGNTYYGDWVGFYTADAYVYFEPEVRTYSDFVVEENSVFVKGYALEGTDVIIEQGFEYWKTGSSISPMSTENRMTVKASGISMSATLANLDYNSTYKYRAYVTTAKGTVYGEEVEFKTKNDLTGVDCIEVDKHEFNVVLRENPATGTAWVKILGIANDEVQYTITSMSGAMVVADRVILDGEWNPIDLNCSAGIYLLTINDGVNVKTLRLIVK
ncbi:MAG: leucine-rich repeat domain-containing protein [Muribaculaceae bacterium]|nr:leucine-rich repeat domain-containing protein [Muribaculaceae bacterium]